MNATNEKKADLTVTYGEIAGRIADIRFDFADGSRKVVYLDDLSPEISNRALALGISNKGRDAAAKSKGTSIAEKRAAVESVIEGLLRGEWSSRRASGEGDGGLLFTALARLYAGRKTPTEIKTYLNTLDRKAQRALIDKSEKLKPIIAAIRAERAPSVDVDDLLDELEG